MQRNLESISSAIKSFRVMWYISSRFSKLHSLRLVLLVFWSRVWRIDAEMFHVHVIPFPHNNTLCISFFVRWKFCGLSFSISVLLRQLYSFLFCNFVFWIHLLNKSYAESLFCTHCQPCVLWTEHNAQQCKINENLLSISVCDCVSLANFLSIIGGNTFEICV